ncbi:MAG: anaerobic C4-dicarboxylate transporter family protein [Zetaproteobacteria bacterium]|nr:anaerobic C4-dicarboxylate transporter family protein [Zetaproteobacteria bacterium]
MIHSVVLILALYLGARAGGVGLGVFGALGLLFCSLATGLTPTEPPTEVLLVILAVVTASGALEVMGGVDLLVNQATRFLEKRTRWITFLGPLVCYGLTFFSGTGHVVYAVLPVIARVARSCGVRPERALTVSVIASQQAVTASPISAATLAMASILIPYGYSLVDIMLVSIPSTLIGVFSASLVMFRYGEDIEPVPSMLSEGCSQASLTSREVRQKAYLGLGMFMIGVLLVIGQGRLTSTVANIPSTKWIQLTMLSVAAAILCLDLKSVQKLPRSRIFEAGIQAIIALLGIAWFGDSFLQNYLPSFSSWFTSVVNAWPLFFTLGQFLLSIGLFSQSATIRAVTPIGMALGISPQTALVSFTAVNGYFILPNYPTMVAAMEFDESKTTRVGKWLFNHSFMLPGIVAVSVSVLVGRLLIYCYTLADISVFGSGSF